MTDIVKCPIRGCSGGQVSYVRRDRVRDVKLCTTCLGKGLIPQETFEAFQEYKKELAKLAQEKRDREEEARRLAKLKEEKRKNRAKELMDSLSEDDKSILEEYYECQSCRWDHDW